MRMTAPSITYTAKDFHVDWFSGQGPGGQNRNKRMNCCRITHIESGLRAVSTKHRTRSANLRDAFHVLASRLLALDESQALRRKSDAVVRTYYFERNEIIDHGSGIRSTIEPVLNGEDVLDEMRKQAFTYDLPRSGRV